MSEGAKVLSHILQASERLRANATALVDDARETFVRARRYTADCTEVASPSPRQHEAKEEPST